MDSYQWLSQRINNIKYQEDAKERAEMLKQFRDKALYENRFHRTGIMRRFVYIKTTNLKKFEEHRLIFEGFYGIEVLRVPPELSELFMETLLQQRSKDLVPLAVIREESNLYRPNSETFSSLSHATRAVNRSRLWSYMLKKEKDGSSGLQSKVYEHRTNGRIDLTRRDNHANTHGEDQSIFGWDDIFVLPQCNNMSYDDLHRFAVKHSSRDMVISAFLKDNIYYKQLLDVEFNKQSPERVVDFGLSVSDFVARNTYYNNPLAVAYGYRNLQNHVLNFGVFFRAARNRRQNNYWNPGLNGGIPLTKKDDEIHELTFMAHDFGHFAIPDLIYCGDNSVNHRRAYIAWRMISEATTMTLADMLFVDSLVQTGVQYNFDTRRIYPLFRDLNVHFLESSSAEGEKGGEIRKKSPEFVANLKKVIRANYRYCLKGDDSLYRQLLGEAGVKDDTTLKRFEEKFMPFFVEDFRWTEHNYDNMIKRSEELRRWWEGIQPIRDLGYLHLKSINDFLADLHKAKKEEKEDVGIASDDGDAFIDRVFEVVFEQKVRPVLTTEAVLLSEDQRRQRGFTRWMAGQLAICARFHFIKESAEFQSRIIDLLLQYAKQESMDLVAANHIRGVFEDYLQVLVDKNLITIDDQATFAELYPLFDPFYVCYDKGATHYEDLAQVSRRIFSLETHREKQFLAAERIVGRGLTEKEKGYLSAASLLVEAGGVRVEGGLYVSRPGVLLLAETHFERGYESSLQQLQQVQVTFLLSGVSVETSLELVAHKEAKVARLTSSKTLAMNLPLFRVQGEDLWRQKAYFQEVLRNRTAFEARCDPRSKKAHPTSANEIHNITLPAAKATSLCYSMILKDFNSLFIGRMGPEGNEEEVREVVRTMARILHQRYPEVILSPEDYLDMKNSKKYESTKSQQQPIASQRHHGDTLLEVQQIADTVVSTEAKELFKELGINVETPDYVQLSEFRSRITYLAFPVLSKKSESKTDSEAYLKKVL